MTSPAKASGNTWIGIDLGTQGVRVTAASDDGHILGTGSHPLTSRREKERHEQDPESWWTALCSACRAALANVPREMIRGVAVDATSGTILLTDRSGNPLTPGLMYDDGRAVAEAARANEVGAAVWEWLGYQRVQPSWALPKLLWLLRHHPELVSRARLAHQSDFINRRLVGGSVAADSSNALKTGYDLCNEAWPLEVLTSLGVPEYVLPPVVQAGTTLGAVGNQAATETGIPAGTRVIAGMTDGCASQISAGALRVGSWNSVIGTTLVLKGVTKDLIRDPLGVVYSHRSPDNHWLPGGASNTGAGILNKQFAGRDLDALGQQATGRRASPVAAYPLAGRGERFPFHAPDAEGFMLGETADEADHYAAVLQGVSFIERLGFDYLAMIGADTGGDLMLTGGATRSPYWCQLRADVLGRAVKLPENAEASFGMCVLAASSLRPITEAAAEMVRVREVIEPRADRRPELMDLYCRLLDELVRRGWLAAAVADHARKRARP